MFFKVLAAMVTADAFDRHAREQQRRAWAGANARSTGVTGALPHARPALEPPGGAHRLDMQAPERPT
ncbi:MAG TPA: hypothetical protein VIM03_07710 [Thermoleophilaceae bacterium]